MLLGAKNYSAKKIRTLLNLVREHLPMGQEGWMVVADEYNKKEKVSALNPLSCLICAQLQKSHDVIDLHVSCVMCDVFATPSFFPRWSFRDGSF